ncbi:MAG: DegV family protein, partial [Anaerolineales bacterium]
KIGVKIVTDSTCDLPQSIIQQLDITVIPLYINIGDQGYLDGVDITRTDFYTNLPDYDIHPTTATPGFKSFTQAYRRLAHSGASEILSIHISESLSATVGVARKAAQRFKEVPVTVHDSHQLSLGTGFQVELAGRMAADGKTIEQILAALAQIIPRSFVAARLDTLDFLRRSGRMNRFMSGLGSLLQLKPILTMKLGQPGSERVRTKARAEARLIQMLEESQPIERFALVHTNAAHEAEMFRAEISHLIPQGEVISMDITPVIGAHIGPDAVGFAIISKTVI